MSGSQGEPRKIDVRLIYERHPFVREILRRITDAGHEAVLIGGAVRDALRARLDPGYRYEPREVDIATSARPEEVLLLFADQRVVEVGRAFGVLKVLDAEGRPYEVATYRSESEYDGRWPKRVELVSELAQDIQRRDFTVNGLAARPDGSVIDHVGGVRDLEEKVIRSIGDPDARFREDYLRMMRAVRFACLLDAELAPPTAVAIRQHAEGLRKISPERVRDELLALLGSARARRGVRLLDELDLLERILPELVACKGVPQLETYHPEGDVYAHTLMALGIADRFIRDPVLKLAVLLHDVGKPGALRANRGRNAAGHDAIGARLARDVARRLRLSNEEIDRVAYLVEQHQRIGHFPDMTRGKQVRFLVAHEDPSHEVGEFGRRYPYFAQLVQLMVADSQASSMQSRAWLPVLQAATRLLLHLQELEALSQARALIDGNDLIALGVPQGPRIGELLDSLYDKIYAGEIRSREQALAEAKRLMSERGLG